MFRHSLMAEVIPQRSRELGGAAQKNDTGGSGIEPVEQVGARRFTVRRRPPLEALSIETIGCRQQ
jgi:hypothetical protein